MTRLFQIVATILGAHLMYSALDPVLGVFGDIIGTWNACFPTARC